mgnify:CR=1 FL=1
MLITQLRNATVLLEFQHAGRPVGLLVDPMLAPRGSLPALRYLGTVSYTHLTLPTTPYV